jgi:hypothetical protein
MWNMITKEDLWNSLMWQKYLAPYFILTWITREEKSWRNDSSHWKELVSSYPMIGKILGCKLGNEEEVRVGENTIMGHGN